MLGPVSVSNAHNDHKQVNEFNNVPDFPDLFEEFSESLTLDDVIPTAEEIDMPTRPHAKRNEKRGPGEYKEAKGFRLCELGKDDMVQIASWHQI